MKNKPRLNLILTLNLVVLFLTLGALFLILEALFLILEVLFLILGALTGMFRSHKKEFLIFMQSGSGKTSLIAHVSRFDVSPTTQSYMNKLLNSESAGLEWSALLAAFPKPSGDLYV